MKEFVISEVKAETAVLVGLITKTQDEAKTKEYLDELEFLADTAGAVTVKRFTQKVVSPNQTTYVGKGKLEEIKQYIKEEEEEDREIGMVIDVIDGQEIVRVTEDMLGEEAKENIEYGFSTLEEELKKAGGTTYGPRITEYRFNNWGSPSEDTVYQDEDLLPPHHDDEEKSDDIFEDDEI